MRISDWSSDVCSSDLYRLALQVALAQRGQARGLWTAPEWTTGQVPDDQGGGKQVASLVPPGSVPLGMPSLSIQQRYLAEGRTSGLPVADSRIFNADRYIRQSAARRLGQECVRTCRNRCAPY